MLELLFIHVWAPPDVDSTPFNVSGSGKINIWTDVYLLETWRDPQQNGSEGYYQCIFHIVYLSLFFCCSEKKIWKTRRCASCKNINYWATDNFKSRDASASKNGILPIFGLTQKTVSYGSRAWQQSIDKTQPGFKSCLQPHHHQDVCAPLGVERAAAKKLSLFWKWKLCLKWPLCLDPGEEAKFPQQFFVIILATIILIVAINIIFAITIIMIARNMFNMTFNMPGVAGHNAGRADTEGIGLQVDTHL